MSDVSEQLEVEAVRADIAKAFTVWTDLAFIADDEADHDRSIDGKARVDQLLVQVTADRQRLAEALDEVRVLRASLDKVAEATRELVAACPQELTDEIDRLLATT